MRLALDLSASGSIRDTTRSLEGARRTGRDRVKKTRTIFLLKPVSKTLSRPIYSASAAASLARGLSWSAPRCGLLFPLHGHKRGQLRHHGGVGRRRPEAIPAAVRLIQPLQMAALNVRHRSGEGLRVAQHKVALVVVTRRRRR